MDGWIDGLMVGWIDEWISVMVNKVSYTNLYPIFLHQWNPNICTQYFYIDCTPNNDVKMM